MSFNPAVSGISGATDVAVSAKQDDQVLTYDSTVDKWRNEAVTTVNVSGLDAALEEKADLDGTGRIPITQIPRATGPAASTMVQRRSAGQVATATAAAADEAVPLAQVQSLIASGGGGGGSSTADVRDKLLSTDTSAADATTWVTIPDLSINDVATGQLWIVEYSIIYRASTTADLTIRFKAGAPFITTANWEINGHFAGHSIGSVNNIGEYQLWPSRYPAAGNTVAAAPGGSGETLDSIITGKFRVKLNGNAISDGSIALEFRQRTLDASNPVQIMAGSYATFARAL